MTFLGSARVGCVGVRRKPSEVECDGVAQATRRKKEGQARQGCNFFGLFLFQGQDWLLLSFVISYAHSSFPLPGGLWGGGRDALLGSTVSVWDRIWSFKKPPLPSDSCLPLRAVRSGIKIKDYTHTVPTPNPVLYPPPSCEDYIFSPSSPIPGVAYRPAGQPYPRARARPTQHHGRQSKAMKPVSASCLHGRASKRDRGNGPLAATTSLHAPEAAGGTANPRETPGR